MNELGDFLEELRKSKGKSIRRASEEIGISHTYLDSLEKGYDPRTKKERTPTPDVLNKIAKYYSVSYLDLLEKTGQVHELTPIEKAVSEYIGVTGFIRSTASSYKSSQLQISSLKEYIEKTEMNDDRMKELTSHIALHEHIIKENDATLPMALHRLNELESLIKDGMQYQKNKVNELLTSIGYQNLNK